MSLYTSISSWGEKMEKRRLRKLEEKTARRKATLERLKQLEQTVTYPQFANSMHAMEGTIATLFNLSGDLTVQRLTTVLAQYIDDQGVALSDLFNHRTSGFKDWIDAGFGLLHKVVDTRYDAHNVAMGRFHHDIQNRQEETNGAILGMYEFLKAMDQNNTGRYLAMQELLRMTHAESMEWHNINQKTTIALFENLTEQFQNFKKEQTVTVAKPDLNWLIDNAEELAALGTAFKALQENNAPPNMATLEAVKSLRALTEHSVSMVDINEALNVKAQEWGVAEDLRLAA